MTDLDEQRRGEIPPWTLGWRLQRALSWAGMTTEQMADELGVARSTVSRWCNDKGHPTRGYLKLWAIRTGVSYDWLTDDIQWATTASRSNHTSRNLTFDLQPEITTRDILAHQKQIDALRSQLHGSRRGPVERRREVAS